MSGQTRDLFSPSSFGSLPTAAPGAAPVLDSSTTPAKKSLCGEVLSYVETLGFPTGTPPLALARIIEEAMATEQRLRPHLLRSPGRLNTLFSQSAVEASYALAILTIVESGNAATVVARLRAC